ncbi:nucleotidyltransferase [Lacihabitans sp. CCS-44]|uniref:nucleotidyltransferase substrate binding protein n=1 Tax=Lacihabitans sp. CCS-44 TaxID=2487331 RepID=UPI0020CDFED0|nr:nucleotidyltransferase substrate binding protein [Lacihabitans sp. CCS-44]MCP9754683.1 nucleotidyltransferase [Lacihabitans sp. CCS-44]
MDNQDIRWKQRFANYRLALANLTEGIEISKPSDLEKSGIIQIFEYTFELAWKTMKDYLKEMEVEVNYPREVIKTAFSYELIEDGDTWIDMLEKRNLMSHTYDKKNAELAYSLIKNEYFEKLKTLEAYLSKKL